MMSDEQKNQKVSRGNVLPPQDISFFCAQISQLLGAGIPLSEGFGVMLEDAGTARINELLSKMRDQLEDRIPLSKVLANSGMFPPYVLRMTEVGEATGQLDRIMGDLSRYYEKEAELKKTLKSAAAYPLVMVVIMLAVLFLLAWQVMPVFEGVFAQLGAEFSPTTSSIIHWIGIFSGAGLGLVALILIVLGVALLVDRGRGNAFGGLRRKLFSRQKLFMEIATCRLAEILSLALHSGMDVDQGAEMALSLVDNVTIENKIKICKGITEKGGSFPEAVKKAGLFTAMQRQMIQVGMRTGKLDETMSRISADCGDEVDDRVSRSMGKLEPVLTTVLSIVAGGILILVMFPLLGVLSSIG